MIFPRRVPPYFKRIHPFLLPERSQFDAEPGEYEICLSNDRRFEQVAKHVMLGISEVVEGEFVANSDNLKREPEVERSLLGLLQ